MKNPILLLLAAALIGPGTVRLNAASALERVDGDIKVLLENSLDQYRALSTRTRAEKIPLVRDLSRHEAENRALRDELMQSRLTAEHRKDRIENLQEEVARAASQASYIDGVLNDFLVNFESRLHVAEDQLYKERLTAFRLALEKPGQSLEDTDAIYLDTVALGLDRLENLIGGTSFDGRSIDREGRVLDGRIALLGPSAYFSSTDGNADGLLVFHSGTIEPKLLPFRSTDAGNIRTFVAAGEGVLPLDASLGNAITLHEVNITLREQIRQGGVVGIAILVLGALALVFSIFILIEIRRVKSVQPEDVIAIAGHVRNNRRDEAIAQVGHLSGAVREMIQVGVENADATVVFLEELMLSVIARTRPKLERFLPFLSITVVAAPLLGLLGTVVGMIKTFALITVFGTGDPKALSSGISEALVTTEIGLVVAIVVLLLHAAFSRVIRSRLGMMERVAFDFVTFVRHGPEED